MTVRERDGIEFELSDGTRVVCDGSNPDGDVNVVTHAHGDHTPRDEATAVCSELTAALATARRDTPLRVTTDDRVDLFPAGHVAGSRAALVSDPDGTRYLYTGDVCTRSRLYLGGFEPPAADVLVVEATYGTPGYVFPAHERVEADVVSWLQERSEPVLLFGYALGRAQKLQVLAERAGMDRVFTTQAVDRVNDVVEAHLDVAFASQLYDGDEIELEAGDALVLPMTTARIDWIDALAEETDAIKAGFSGWAVDASFMYRGNYDVTFPLSDHCDFEELVSLVETVDPEEVFTQHGSADRLAVELTNRGFDATALQKNQTSLADF